MIIKLLSKQIPQHWKTIKLVAMKTNSIHENTDYLLELLQSLLSDKAQCFFRIKDGKVTGVMITRVKVDTITSKNFLFIQSLYSFEGVTEDIYIKDWSVIEEFAKRAGCHYALFESSVPRVWKIAEASGFKEAYRTYRLEVM